jgi:hypothetical protein
MLDHEERFLFREEIHTLANALGDAGQLDNVEDLLAEVTTSPRFDSDVFTLERSLQVMLGARAGSTLVGLLTVDRGVFEELGDIGLPPEVHERLVSWRARFGLVIDNALNFLNNPDGIQGHNFGTQLSHTDGGLTLQGRLTLVRYNNEPQFFIADATCCSASRRTCSSAWASTSSPTCSTRSSSTACVRAWSWWSAARRRAEPPSGNATGKRGEAGRGHSPASHAPSARPP